MQIVKTNPYSIFTFKVNAYAFFRSYHLDAYGPHTHTGTFLLWFSKGIARGAVQVI